jgi:hypothetical protein
MIAKPYAKLKRADFEACPVWAWFVPEDEAEAEEADEGGMDKSFVQPTSHTAIPTGGLCQYLVSATIGLHRGDDQPGILEVTVADGEVSVAPLAVFLLDRKLRVPAVETNRLLARYTKTTENHPVRWKARVRIAGEDAEREGTIAGGDMKDLLAVGLDMLQVLKALRRP